MPDHAGHPAVTQRLRAILCIVAVLLLAPPALAAEAPMGLSGRPVLNPTAVRLHLHDSIRDQAFTKPLLVRLRASLAAPVGVQPFRFDLAPFEPFWGKLDGFALIEPMAQAIYQAGASKPGAIDFVMIADDMRGGEARFLFAASSGDETTPMRLGIVSLARLQRQILPGAPDADPERTAERVFKMVLKNTARLAGYTTGQGCLFNFPRSLKDLDALPLSFCNADTEALTAAGILK